VATLDLKGTEHYFVRTLVPEKHTEKPQTPNPKP
jgi:hypothetical protein